MAKASLRHANTLRLVVHGAAGRMGQRIVACAASDSVPWQLVAAIERAGHAQLGIDAGVLAGISASGVTVSEAWTCPADVVIDFSLPGAVAGIAAACVQAHLPLVVATTGLEEADRQAISNAAQKIPILQSPSMSLAVNITMDLVGRAAELLQSVGVRRQSGGAHDFVWARRRVAFAECPSDQSRLLRSWCLGRRSFSCRPTCGALFHARRAGHSVTASDLRGGE